MGEDRVRRRLEMALGCLWLLDGALQFQPYMFTKEFFAGILGMANMGLPGPVAADDYRVASLLVAHPVVWNSLFASLQVLIGLGLLWPRTARVARAVSIPWALGVWVIGEGFGGWFMGGMSLLTGVPGSALIYAVLAILLWPEILERKRARFGIAAWVVLWCGSALVEFETVNHLPTVPGAQITNGGFNQPGWLTAVDRAAGHLVRHTGTEFAVVLGVGAALIGLGVLWRATRRPALVGGIVVAVLVGVLGQDFGNIATGQGTDPGTGPLLVLLALTLWHLTARPQEEAIPAPAPEVPHHELALQSQAALQP